MARGGRREGAGRKAGHALVSKAQARLLAADNATRQLIPDIAEEIARLTPLDVMMIAMRDAAQAGDWKAAHRFAESAAPYVQPKLATVNVSNSIEVNARELTTEELQAAIAKLGIIDASFE